MKNIIKKAFLDEKSRAYYVFNDILAVIILFSVFVIVAESVSEWEANFHSFFVLSEIVFVTLFTIEYILRIIYTENKLRYIFSIFGIIDLLAILPSFIIFFAPLAINLKSLRVLRVLRVLRLLRVFRVLKLIAYSKRRHPKAISTLERLPWYNIEIYFFALFSVIIIAGSLMYIAESNISGTLFTSIPQGLWWAVVTVTTVGYGDMIPATAFGKIIAAFTMIAGLTLFTLLITVMGRTMQNLIFGSPIEDEKISKQ